jgi:hypothetical protein
VAVKEHCDEYEMKDMDMNPVISYGRVAKQCRERWQVRARHFSSTLYAKNAHFTKTGSGQT